MVTLLEAVGLERIFLNTHISTYARTNRCYNERGSRTNYVRSSIPHGISNSVRESTHFTQSCTLFAPNATNCPLAN